MSSIRPRAGSALCVLFLAILTACGGSGGLASFEGAQPDSKAGANIEGSFQPGDCTAVRVDGGTRAWPVSDDGQFRCEGVPDGDHTLFCEREGGEAVEIPCRIFGGADLDLGEVEIEHDRYTGHSGFSGYLCGFLDADGDGRNDQFADADGDGVCDAGFRWGGRPYMMNHGFADLDGDGVNDRYCDADGDHLDDRDDRPCGPAFGWIDEDADGVHDWFRDANGDGVCDVTSMPLRHPFGWSDADSDGVNDRFRDADGDCVNDVDGESYMCMPGWSDVDEDGRNDLFCDANGDGVNDAPGVPFTYGHGCGWVDADGDGVNDNYVDADGDGVNDLPRGPYAGGAAHYGWHGAHPDADGNGVDDETGEPYCHGFGWSDTDADGVNDRFTDRDGDGVRDADGRHYGDGFAPPHPEDGHGPWSGGMGPMHGA